MKVDSSYERGRPGWCDNNVECTVHTLHSIWSKLVPMQHVKVWIAHYSQSVSVLCATVCRMWSVMLPPPPRPGQCSAWHYATRLSLPFCHFYFSPPFHVSEEKCILFSRSHLHRLMCRKSMQTCFSQSINFDVHRCSDLRINSVFS